MKAKVLSTIKQFNMLNSGETVAVGLSGGADSVSLLYILNELKDELGISLIAAHLNHCIRGAEADRDESFAVDFCESHNIPIRVLRLDIPQIAKLSGESIELCARKKRYEFFDSLGADKIATAHTGSDRIETFLINLSRGSGLSGLCSIPPVRDNIIRPLIDVTREEIERFCEDQAILYVNDSTNFTEEYTRNKYRLKVIPELKSINPSFEQSALRCIRLLNDENDYITDLSDKEIQDRINDDKLDISAVKFLDKALLRRILTVFLKNNCCDYEAKHIDFILSNCGSRFSIVLPGNKKISSDGRFLFAERQNIPEEILPERAFTKADCKNETVCINGLTIGISDTDCADGNTVFSADAEKICDILTVRSRRNGDVFHFADRHCSKTLKKLFNELKIPKEKRNKICVIADENGVIFVDGVGIDAKRAVSSQTKHFLIIKTECGNNE
ncbi:MAG: tRNA lysidine(34) synthetase TilS [Ruminococcaceae bacterium]|nr:tRNA lysidine(34) synthetase TilS [Oscillospiraceae bacterium]